MKLTPEAKCCKNEKIWVIVLTIIIVVGVVLTLTLYFTLKTENNTLDTEIATSQRISTVPSTPAIETEPTSTSTTSSNDCLNFDDYRLVASSKLRKFRNAAVTVDSETCATTGKDILLQNGSAVDAAIATALCDSIFNPQSMGIGGGNFMLIYLRENKTVIGIDAREMAYLRINEKQFIDNPSLLSRGGLATAVPGEIAGFWKAHQLAGRLPWKQLFQPAIKYCRSGVTVSASLEEILQYFEQDLIKNEFLKKKFINPKTNQIYKQNDTIYFPELANTFEIIAEKGAEAFYDGELSQVVVDEINSNGGNFSLYDLKSYEALERTPIEVKLTDKYRAYVMPTPSRGVLVTFIINVMKRFNLSADSISTPEKQALFYHRLLETYKHTFAIRYLLGDSDFVNMTDIIGNLTDGAYSDYILSRINDSQTFDYTYYNGGLSRDDHGTAHISIVASNGDAVSMTSSINYFFGGFYSGSLTGIIYNNNVEDFALSSESSVANLPPNTANYMKPGKRPMSSMSPMIILDENDNVRLVLGGAGASRITTSVSATAIANLFLGMNIKEAIDAPRLHHALVPEVAYIEKDIPEDIRSMLRQKGHKICSIEFASSICQGIERRANDELWANSDYRKRGRADGY